ncbi:Hydantoinase/oxoprolinase-domain-containing protein [Mycena belliarum]|uniref:Hydantoinase/oxoprolinase-domain-containing protein n=1 Tax=Mycena belliarum TaxID=1033014 RepID=A0AAD6XMA5_9AGAR|nr:Hydantoinase/oxoprolinase-domain-containing protein [Mycena belliae]
MQHQQSEWKLGIDVGGTFTDLTLYSARTGEQYRAKVHSTPADPSVGVLNGVAKIRELAPNGPNLQFEVVNHGTTVATNAILEGKGARVALLVSEGYRDTLQVRRSQVPGGLAGWIVWPKPTPLVSLELTAEVPGRIATDGLVVRPFDEAALEKALEPLKALAPESICVSLINSFANAEHELATLPVIKRVFPGLPVTLSSSLVPEIYEFERTVTTAANAYVRPQLESYLHNLQAQLGPETPLRVLRSDGGLASVESAKELCANLLYSGPAGGVTGAVAQVAKRTKYKSFLTVDIGGTSSDVCLIENGVPQIRRDTTIGDLTVRCPSIDVRTVGAGGGSIAHVPELSGALRVGPESAGAVPGPACYAHGGTQATVSDANAVLGYLPLALLGGSFQLDLQAAKAAIQPVADALGLNIYQAAEGIVKVSVERINGALRSISVEKGFDPRDFSLVAFGGAGGLSACFLADLLGSYPAIVPPSPGVLCALGAATTGLRSQSARTFVRPLKDEHLQEVADMCESLLLEAKNALLAQGVSAEESVKLECEADLRYKGQATSLPVNVGSGKNLLANGFKLAAEQFAAAHKTMFTFNLDLDVEIAMLRAVASEIVEDIPSVAFESGTATPDDSAQAATTRLYFEGKHFENVQIWDRALLKAGNKLHGPCIITEMDSTTLVLPTFKAEIDTVGNILMWPDEAARGPVAEDDDTVDPVTLQLVESAFLNARLEMDALITRVAMSPAMREQLDFFPMIADSQGRMIVGQFGSFLHDLLPKWGQPMLEGDVYITNDPYAVSGAISHLNDMLIIMPIYFDHELIGWASNLGHFTDLGGSCAGSMPNCAHSIYEEGIQVPVSRLYAEGVPNRAVFEIIERNCRTHEFAKADLQALVAACRIAGTRICELAKRFGVKKLKSTMDAMLERNKVAVGKLIDTAIPDEPISFTDYIDDDGNGFGPWRITCKMWKEPAPDVHGGKRLVFDFDGTDPQSEYSINFYLSHAMLKMFASIYLLMVYDPATLPNDGCYSLIDIRIPEGTILSPIRPAALSCRTHLLGRIFDVLGALFGQRNPDFLSAAGFSDSPHLFYSAWDKHGDYQQLYQIGFGGIPARPHGDGPDGHSLWPSMRSVPNEVLENKLSLRVDRYETVIDSGGAGFYRGGNGIRIDYVWLEPGEISIHDDRWLTKPWGVHGGEPGCRSKKTLVKAKDGKRIILGSKIDAYPVDAGDILEWVTWGGGGWGDALERDPNLVAKETRERLVSVEAAKTRYGVVVASGRVDVAATDALRASMRAERGNYKPDLFNRGGTVKELLASCETETGLPAPKLPSGRDLRGPVVKFPHILELQKRRRAEDNVDFGL